MSRYPAITPHLAIADVAAALEFYAEAFGAKERLRLTMPVPPPCPAGDVRGGETAALGALGCGSPDPDPLGAP